MVFALALSTLGVERQIASYAAILPVVPFLAKRYMDILSTDSSSVSVRSRASTRQLLLAIAIALFFSALVGFLA